MAATLTVPGGSSGTVTLTFATAASSAIAANLLSAVYAAGTNLFVGTGSTAASTIPGAVNEYLVPAGTTGTVTVPAGYSYVVDAAAGVTTIVGNNQANEIFVATAATNSGFVLNGFGSGTIVAGGGSDTVVSYTTGTSITTLGDSSIITDFVGPSSVFVPSAGSAGTQVGVFFGSGSIGGAGGFLYSIGSNSSITDTGTSSTIVAGAGSSTISASASGGVYFDYFGSLSFAGTGSSTVVAASNLNATAGGGTSVFIGAGGGTASILNPGSGTSYAVEYGTATVNLTDGPGGTVQLLSPNSGNAVHGGTGNETISAAFSTGANSVFGGSGSDLVYLGFSGADTFYAGSGNASVNAPAADTFVFTAGSTGGGTAVNDAIYNFGSSDKLVVSGYGVAAETAAVNGGSVVSGFGSTAYQFTLPDKTTVYLFGLTSAPSSTQVTLT